jgi:hypothetical protein
MRRKAEIVARENEYFQRLWYQRHRVLRPKYDVDGTPEDIKRESDDNAARIEERFDPGYPVTDFKMGELTGTLRALRWVLGYDWTEGVDT